MKKIPSFSIDHIHLLRGIYVSRKDYLGDQVVTTFDIRMKEPNREPALGYGELHTFSGYLSEESSGMGRTDRFLGPDGLLYGKLFPDERRFAGERYCGTDAGNISVYP